MAVIVYFLLSSLMATSYGISYNNGKGLENKLPTSELLLLNESIQDDNYITTEEPSTGSTKLQRIAPYFTNRNQMGKVHVVAPGKALHLKCKAGGHPSPNITWYKNNKLLTRSLGRIEYRQWSLILEALTIDDSGNYRCVVCNVLGCVNYNYTVDIVEKLPPGPYIKDGYPENVTVMENSTAILKCPTSVSDLLPFIQWTKSINKDDDIHNGTVLETSATLENPEMLVLHNVTRESEGWYTCVAINSLGMDSKSAYVRVVNGEETIGTWSEFKFKIWLFVFLGAATTILICTVVAIIFAIRRLRQLQKYATEFLPVETEEAQQNDVAERL